MKRFEQSNGLDTALYKNDLCSVCAHILFYLLNGRIDVISSLLQSGFVIVDVDDIYRSNLSRKLVYLRSDRTSPLPAYHFVPPKKIKVHLFFFFKFIQIPFKF